MGTALPSPRADRDAVLGATTMASAFSSLPDAFHSASKHRQISTQRRKRKTKASLYPAHLLPFALPPSQSLALPYPAQPLVPAQLPLGAEAPGAGGSSFWGAPGSPCCGSVTDSLRAGQSTCRPAQSHLCLSSMGGVPLPEMPDIPPSLKAWPPASSSRKSP